MVITSQDMKSQTVQSDVTGELMYVNFDDRNDLMDCSYEMAESIGKTDELMVSRNLDRKCAKAIDEALHDYYDYDACRLDKHVLEPVFQEFCPERIRNVLANSFVNDVTPPDYAPDFWDQRYRENKDWIKENASRDEEQRLTSNYNFNTNPTLLNEFISLFRKETDNMELLQDLTEINYFEPKFEFVNFNDEKNYYPHSFEYARENGETDLFNKSYRANKWCAKEIDAAIEASWDGMRMEAISAITPVLENYCPERISRITADTILYEANDGRISAENRDWAKTIRPDWDMAHPDDHISVLSIHPDKVNQFANAYRESLPRFNKMEEKWKNNIGLTEDPADGQKHAKPAENNFRITDVSAEDRSRFCTDMDAIAARLSELGTPQTAQSAFCEFSHTLSVICKNEIETDIFNDPADQKDLDQTGGPVLEDGVTLKAAETFCPERISHILSETILSNVNQGFGTGISDENISWAESQVKNVFHPPGEYSKDYLAKGVTSSYLNEFTDHFRSEVLREDLTKDHAREKTDEMQLAESESERASPPVR